MVILNFKSVALQYVIKNYVHTKIMNYIQNILMKVKSKKIKAQEESPTCLTTFNLLRLEFIIVFNKIPNWIQVETTKECQISKDLDHRHCFTRKFWHKIFFLEFEQGK